MNCISLLGRVGPTATVGGIAALFFASASPFAHPKAPPVPFVAVRAESAPGIAPTTGPDIPPAPLPPPTTSTTAPAARPVPITISGAVRDAGGAPVADAYVIGLVSLHVTRTDATGRYSMPCQSEPLVASPWLVPIVGGRVGRTPLVYGQNTTNYGPPPAPAGLGYSFSGGAIDATRAPAVHCDGQAQDFVLGPGTSVDVQILNGSGPEAMAGIPPDNFYLPALGHHAALETVPLMADGHQVLNQLSGGVLLITGTTDTLVCSGPGVTNDPSIAGARVTVPAGATLRVTCNHGASQS